MNRTMALSVGVQSGNKTIVLQHTSLCAKATLVGISKISYVCSATQFHTKLF